MKDQQFKIERGSDFQSLFKIPHPSLIMQYLWNNLGLKVSSNAEKISFKDSSFFMEKWRL